MDTETAQSAPPASGASISFHLDSRMTAQNAPMLLENLQAFRGEDLDLDASSVVSVSTPWLQILLAAGEGWRKDGRTLRITDPSTDFLMALDHLGISLELLQSQESTPCL